jgi:hypothetical protein
MITAITIQSTPEFIICHGLGHRGAAGYFSGPLGDKRRSAKWSVARKRPIRAVKSTPVDRGLAEYVFDLTVDRLFDTESAAEAYADALPELMPRGNNDILIEDDEVPSRTHHDTVLEAIDILQIGALLEITFIFQTDGCTQEAPAP